MHHFQGYFSRSWNFTEKKLQDFPGGMGTLLAKFPDISRFPEIPETLTAYKVSMFLQYSLFLGDNTWRYITPITKSTVAPPSEQRAWPIYLDADSLAVVQSNRFQTHPGQHRRNSVRGLIDSDSARYLVHWHRFRPIRQLRIHDARLSVGRKYADTFHCVGLHTVLPGNMHRYTRAFNLSK